ncbi:GNAT family N-acetyltransferase [Paenibacillus hexagrammi]|uniref:GNAT family N-acetyltransferase n=1 Tax=Paenibacillus hexagrammi TaxID=2908839 RepID=A0ABY3SJB0_9BACL|nr:GNAT family N-acetyltransferase [Paenibacillus sp. YPD9-1]UJF33888.1 GNAT family N-acetyltransferase [Paenibacillus sp. YPD9-1]
MEIKQIGQEMTWSIRQRVLWPSKDIAYVQLEEDAQGVHYGVYLGEELVSVISLFVEGEEAQFRKFATLEQEQGKGYGSRLLAYILKELEHRGIKRVWCNARQDKAPFYQRFGMIPTGQVFVKEDVSYVIMEKAL